MSMYFSDREHGEKPQNKEEINVQFWNGLISIIESFFSDNAFSKSFPAICSDNNRIYSYNRELFEKKLKGHITNIKLPLDMKEEKEDNKFEFLSKQDDDIDKIEINDTLDLIEFCYLHIDDAIEGKDKQEYFKYFYLEFPDTNKNKRKFIEEVNLLFYRNQIAFKLNEEGKIERIIPKELNNILYKNFNTIDEELNKLLSEATEYIIKPKVEDRKRALERLWDAFERIKSLYGDNKRKSSQKLIELVSKENELLEEYLNDESTTLTKIGNKFNIRHYETNTQSVNEIIHIDYLFFRLYSLMILFLTGIEINN